MLPEGCLRLQGFRSKGFSVDGFFSVFGRRFLACSFSRENAVVAGILECLQTVVLLGLEVFSDDFGVEYMMRRQRQNVFLQRCSSRGRS